MRRKKKKSTGIPIKYFVGTDDFRRHYYIMQNNPVDRESDIFKALTESLIENAQANIRQDKGRSKGAMSKLSIIKDRNDRIKEEYAKRIENGQSPSAAKSTIEKHYSLSRSTLNRILIGTD